jgi:hypothetical protein
MIDGLRRQIKAVEKRAVSEDPWMAADMLGLAGQLEEATVRVIAAHRRNGYRWDDIGFSLGITGLTALKRYKKQADEINAARAAAGEGK